MQSLPPAGSSTLLVPSLPFSQPPPPSYFRHLDPPPPFYFWSGPPPPPPSHFPPFATILPYHPTALPTPDLVWRTGEACFPPPPPFQLTQTHHMMMGGGGGRERERRSGCVLERGCWRGRDPGRDGRQTSFGFRKPAPPFILHCIGHIP